MGRKRADGGLVKGFPTTICVFSPLHPFQPVNPSTFNSSSFNPSTFNSSTFNSSTFNSSTFNPSPSSELRVGAVAGCDRGGDHEYFGAGHGGHLDGLGIGDLHKIGGPGGFAVEHDLAVEYVGRVDFAGLGRQGKGPVFQFDLLHLHARRLHAERAAGTGEGGDFGSVFHFYRELVGAVVVVTGRLIQRFAEVRVKPDLKYFAVFAQPLGVADAVARPDDLDIAGAEWPPFPEFGIVVADFAFQYKGADFEALVRVQPDGAVGHRPGMRPIKQIGIRPHAGVILRESDGFVFDNFAAVESAVALLFFWNDSDRHKLMF